MMVFKVLVICFIVLLHIVMMGIMIILERDKPRNIIIWSIIFLFTQCLGYITYALIRNNFYLKRKDLVKKQQEDDIYLSLISSKLNNATTNSVDDIFKFNEMAYNSKLTVNNRCDIIEDYAKFKSDLISAIKSAKSYIILELRKFNKIDFEDIKACLIAKAEEGVAVKLVHDRLINAALKKQLIAGGVKVYRFSKYNTIGGVYSNFRNQIVIDGKVAYLANTYLTKKQLADRFDKSEIILKLKGDIVEEIDVATHQDYVFASSKFMEYNPLEKERVDSTCTMQYVKSEESTDIALLIIKAICSAKKSIQLQLEEFIPTESITSLLKFAIDSNINVRLMVPLKTNNHSKYFATRAYAKELALMGANVYLYDGYIRFNSIVVDDEYVLYGSFVLDREHISMGLQNVMVIKNDKVVNHFNKTFDKDINNSYRINNAKYMLLREKFFKNFV